MAARFYTSNDNPFIDFWSNLNDVAKTLGHKPETLGHTEIGYGPARNYWEAHCDDRDDKWIRAVLVTAADKSTWHGEYRYLGSGWRQVRNTGNQPICYASEAAAFEGARYSRECRHA